MDALLDANILIDPGERPEHDRLREAARAGQVKLFFAHTAVGEQQKRALNQRFGPLREALLRWEQDRSEQNRQSVFAEALKNDLLEAKNEQEFSYWNGCGIQYASCTFNILIEEFGSLAIGFPDLKGELPQYVDLVEQHKVHAPDALHLMVAHSASIEYFLTWENSKTLRNRALRARWLVTKIMSPAAFLDLVAKR